MVSTRYVAIGLVALVLLNSGFVWAIDTRVNSQSQQLSDMSQNQQSLESTVIGMSAADGESLNGTGHVSTEMYAVSMGDGTAVPIHVTKIPTEGYYLNITGISYRDGVQEAFRKAALAAENTSYQSNIPGVIIEVRAPDQWQYLQGQSGALPVAAALAATNDTYKLNSSVAMTGRLTSDGQLLEVGDIKSKAQEARARGMKRLIIPADSPPVNVDGIRITRSHTLPEALEQILERA